RAARRDATIEKVVIHRPGAHDRLRLEVHPVPTPRGDQVLIDVRAAGVNYADVIVRMGLYASAKELVGWPITPGFEVAGVVRAVGPAVDDLAVGDRVMAGLLFGGYASAVVAPRAQVFRVPEGLSFEQAAGIPAVYLTGWFALHFLAHPRPGDRVLVHSAAGGVGSTLVQLAKRSGCEVTGVVGRSAKVEVAEATGCDHVIDKSTEDLWARAEAISARGFDVICDANGVATLKGSYEHLRRAGKLVVYGFATMLPKRGGKPSYPKLAVDYLRTPRFDPLDLTNQSKSVLAFNLSYLFDRMDLLADAMRDLLAWIEAGELQPPRTTCYALRDVADAHRHIESGASVGKLILKP
ncbi:MAG TPA: medium chain dehydrogenase/reductase family protein, partial [Sandaracinaceae bacterium LLY-WYZ-13_1]|nr:medium chain dehydrogenase/reductase family protein [Sandaracinaceae bacterium LLY-WYZ-13_1]